MRNEKYDTWVRGMRERIREKIYPGLFQAYQKNSEKGIYPYDGVWLTVAQIKAVQERLKKQDKTVLTELLVLFSFTVFLSLVLFWLLFVFFLPR